MPIKIVYNKLINKQLTQISAKYYPNVKIC